MEVLELVQVLLLVVGLGLESNPNREEKSIVV